jgi:hypothetical protein
MELKTRLSPWWVIAGDLAIFFAFGLVGLNSHDRAATVSAFSRAILPFAAGWVLFAYLAPWTRITAACTPEQVGRAWIPAWLVGLLLRSLVFGRQFAPTFAIIAFLFQGVLLLLWRLLAARRTVGRASGIDE